MNIEDIKGVEVFFKNGDVEEFGSIRSITSDKDLGIPRLCIHEGNTIHHFNLNYVEGWKISLEENV